MSLAAFALVGLIALALWYLSAKRSRLDLENAQELAQAGQDLQQILSDLRSSAEKFFTDPEKQNRNSLIEFARRNPYVDSLQAESVSTKTGKTDAFCAALESPQKLSLSGAHFTTALPLDTQKMLDDVAISDAFEMLFIADDKGRVRFAASYGEASRHQEGFGWLD